jgi:DNA-binding NarL/FixJ family response regulator
MTVRVVVAHRSTLVRDVLRLLGVADDVIVVGEAENPAALLELCTGERPDVVLAEATFQDGTEIESCLPPLLAGGARVAVIGDDITPERLIRILALGASGYFCSDASPPQVVEAMAVLARGAAVLEPTVAGILLEEWRGLGAAGTRSSGTPVPS